MRSSLVVGLVVALPSGSPLTGARAGHHGQRVGGTVTDSTGGVLPGVTYGVSTRPPEIPLKRSRMSEGRIDCLCAPAFCASRRCSKASTPRRATSICWWDRRLL